MIASVAKLQAINIRSICNRDAAPIVKQVQNSMQTNSHFSGLKYRNRERIRKLTMLLDQSLLFDISYTINGKITPHGGFVAQYR
jgi:hypothetical protein